MKIAAVRGDAYIVEEADGRNGFVADVRKRVRFPRFLLMALYARGYWEKVEHDPALLQQILSWPELSFEETRSGPRPATLDPPRQEPCDFAPGRC